MENSVYKRVEKSHLDYWWFSARRKIFGYILNNIYKKKIQLLDYGCGVVNNHKIYAKISKSIHIYDRKKILQKYKNNNLVKIYKKNSQIKFDLIILTDVLEHIKYDNNLLKQLSNLLNKNGKILITVPAFNFLFSSKDKQLHHYRRYDKSELKNKINKFFILEKISYYNFFLFIPISIIIIYNKIFNLEFIDKVEKKPNHIINKLLYWLFSLEKFFLFNFPFFFGLSIIAIAKKSD
jgi:SAM-dependent methyltransferase